MTTAETDGNNLKTLTVRAADLVDYDQPLLVGSVLVVEMEVEPTADNLVVLWDDEREAMTFKRCGPDPEAHRPAYVVAVVRHVSHSPRAG